MTVYEETMKNMSAENLAKILVKPCVLNMEELYYVTTTGQLYPFNNEGFKGAVQLQLQYLNTSAINDSEMNSTQEKRAKDKNETADDFEQLSLDDYTNKNLDDNDKH